MGKIWYCRYKLPKHNEPSQERNETNQTEDPNPELNEENLKLNEEENPKDEIHEDLNQLIILSDELKNTRKLSRVALATSIQNIIESINIAHSEITSLSEYRARMREHYSTDISKADIKNDSIFSGNYGLSLC